MAKRRAKKEDSGPQLIPPSQAQSDAVERVAPKKLQLERGDVVIVREALPAINPKPIAPPSSRYRVAFAPELRDGSLYNSFQHAASAGMQLATTPRRARLIYLEEGIPSLIADHRAT